jgi:serine/arginine repetitive matrix protein 1
MATTVDQKLLRATKFPPEFNQKVDMRKVEFGVMKGCVSSALQSCTQAY